jgi:hypothetical protein
MGTALFLVLSLLMFARAFPTLQFENDTACVCASAEEMRGWLTTYEIVAIGLVVALVSLLLMGAGTLAGVYIARWRQKAREVSRL